DIMAYLRIVYNMSDAVSWHRALLLMRGIGPKKAEQVIQEVVAKKRGAQFHDVQLMKYEDLAALFEILKEIKCEQQGPSELIQAFLKYYQPLLQDKYDDFNKRLNDLDSLMRISSRYTSLEGFLADMALDPPERSIVEAGIRDRDDTCLTLSTIHSAKGLEWHTVFLIYAAEGHLPSYLSLENEDDIEEERRLFYVATTRAKENLYILKPHLDRAGRGMMGGEGGSIFTQVSRFLDEGDILNKYCRIESVSSIDEFSDIDQSRPEYGVRSRNEKLLEHMKEYFRNMDSY
ncbi:MAG: ATP-dependent helicase, partial [Candidatus Omnitrophica bacterium]|nr:ATP-dependent helicase [Candidatus Omnitrophota bacterium]